MSKSQKALEANRPIGPNARVSHVICWRLDVRFGIADNNTYLGFKSVSQRDLDSIISRVNSYFLIRNSPLRVANSMGEIVPYVYTWY